MRQPPNLRYASRRDVIRAGASGLLLATLLGDAIPAFAHDSVESAGQAPTALWPGYPRQDLKLVAEVVGAAHMNEQRVRELVKSYPELVNAWWDWGYGDWESPLGAAAHVGERGTAEFLIANGARIDIFAAAMLGLTDVVKALVLARPGIQGTLGPHNITLLAHAEAGGKSARGTVDYLKSIDGADSGPKVVPLAAERKLALVGEYVSKLDDVKVVCRLNRTELLVADVITSTNQSTGRLLRHIGGDTFFPAGVPSVTLQFAVESGVASSVTVKGSVPTIELDRK